MRILNVPMRPLLALPFRTPLSRNLMLITVTGRTTGRVYRQPVSYVRDADVLLTPGGGRWTRNLTPGRPVRIRLDGHPEPALPELVRNAGEVEHLLRRMLAGNPRVKAFLPFLRNGELDRRALDTALRYGFCVVRWHLAAHAPPEAGGPGDPKETIMNIADEIHDLDRRWADAEQRGDVAALEALTVDDFTLVGPAGFVLDRRQWLQRYRDGDLVTRLLRWEDVEVREYAGTAVAVGRHTQEASYRGTPADGSFRATHVAVRRDGRWLLAGMHLSPIGGPPPFARRPDARPAEEAAAG